MSKINPPKRHSYSTCFGSAGCAEMQIIFWDDYSDEDIKDLRDWLALIDRQVSRMEEKIGQEVDK